MVVAGCGGQSADTTANTQVTTVGQPEAAPGMSDMGAPGGMGAATGGMIGDPMGGMGAAPGGGGPSQPNLSAEEISAQRKAEAQQSIAEGDRLLKEGDHDSAINEYEMALIDDPDNESVKSKIARAKAVKAETKRRNVQKLVARGRTLFYRGEYMRAASVLEQAIQQDPLHREAVGYLVASGIALKNLQDYGWQQPGLGGVQQGGGQMGGGASGMGGMPDMPGGAMGMPGMSGMPGGAMPGLGGGSGGGMGGRRGGEG
jgi:hypothetical protein